MGTSDVLKVLKIARAVGEYNLRTFKTSRVTINYEMHKQVHTIFLPTSQPSEDTRLARQQRIVPREELLMQKNSRSAFEKCNCKM